MLDPHKSLQEQNAPVTTCNHKTTLAVIQARMSSTRLPGKSTMLVAGKPLLVHVLERVQRASHIDHVVVATSDTPLDDDIAAVCEAVDVECFRGSLDNVLDRYYQAAAPHSPDFVVRVTGDCPLADPDVIDLIVQHCIYGDFDYASNNVKRSFPHGLDAEVFRFSCLEEANREATSDFDREHVTPFIKSHPERYSISYVESEIDRSFFRWTVDWAEDLEQIRFVFEALYPDNPCFTTDDVIFYLEEHPEIMALNTNRNDAPMAATFFQNSSR
jgi:spore coat polysaccharide biosynthesis protein SpsF